jgi:hypothetical protein
MKYRLKVLETRDSSEYLVDAVINSNKSPRSIVKEYLKIYPDVYMIEAYEENPHRLNSYSESHMGCA